MIPIINIIQMKIINLDFITLCDTTVPATSSNMSKVWKGARLNNTAHRGGMGDVKRE